MGFLSRLLEKKESGISLYTFLTLYLKASPTDVYIEYMNGAKLLIDFFGPIQIPTDKELTKPVPLLCNSYEIQELARYLKCDQRIIFWTALKVTEDIANAEILKKEIK